MTKVLKVELEYSLGFSIQTEAGDWIKSGVRINEHIDGQPTPETMSTVIDFLAAEAREKSVEQIDLIVTKANEASARLKDGD